MWETAPEPAELPVADVEVWQKWVVCPQSGFEVYGNAAPASVPLLQKSGSQFWVGRRFHIENGAIQKVVLAHLAKVHAFDDDGDGQKRQAAYRNAAAYTPTQVGGPDEPTTDLASIPRFMRWYVNTYGEHTLAAILHDQLIGKPANSGALKSDVVSDRFFREMLHACGTPYFKRWVMWTAVAMRTRWAAGGWTRVKLVAWALSSAVGMGGTCALFVAGRQLLGVGFGAALLLVAGLLWGRQWGAAVFAAVALPFVIPAAVLVLVATAVLWFADEVGCGVRWAVKRLRSAG